MSGSAALVGSGPPPTLADEILSGLTSLGHTPPELRIPRGELVSLQHGRGAGVHIVRRGRIKVLRFSTEGRVILLDLMQRGDVFGEMPFSQSSAASSNYAEALEETVLLVIPPMTFQSLLSRRPAVALRVAGLLGERCTQLERRLEAHVFQKVPTRLAAQLLELAARYGMEEPDGTLLPVPLSQQDLGNLIGASREIVSLTLSSFKRRGLVSTRGRRLILHESELRDELGQPEPQPR